MTTLILGLMPEGAQPDGFLAAGPWCFAGQERKFPGWEREFSFAPEPLSDPELLPVAARACQTLCVRLIPEAARMLEPEADRLPPVYWQILLAPWLMDLCSQIVDRNLRCAAMRAAWQDKKLTVPCLPPDCEFSFLDEHDFTLRGSLGPMFNHWLFSRLLEADWPANWEKQELPAISLPPAKDTGGILAKMRSAGRNIGLRLLFPKVKGLGLADALKLSGALNHVCHQPDRSLDLEIAFNFEADLARIELPAGLSLLLRKALPASLKRLVHKPAEIGKSGPRLRIASIASHEDAVYRQQLARWRSAGNRIAHIQHGGNYGTVETPCTAEVCEYSQDAFFTWGWKTQGCAKGNFIPMPAFQLSEKEYWRQGQELIFVGTEMPAYARRLDSHPTPLQYLEYRRDKERFFVKLGQELQDQSLYRPYFPLPGTLADADWLLPKFPGLRLCEGDLLPQLLNCRILVIDHPGTTLLEAMAAGIPVIAYWNRKYWPFAPEASILLDLLSAAGIWHDSPEAAAAMARQIWQNSGLWNNDPERRLARDVFSRKQALAAPDVINQWLKKLREL